MRCAANLRIIGDVEATVCPIMMTHAFAVAISTRGVLFLGIAVPVTLLVLTGNAMVQNSGYKGCIVSLLCCLNTSTVAAALFAGLDSRQHKSTFVRGELVRQGNQAPRLNELLAGDGPRAPKYISSTWTGEKS